MLTFHGNNRALETQVRIPGEANTGLALGIFFSEGKVDTGCPIQQIMQCVQFLS